MSKHGAGVGLDCDKCKHRDGKMCAHPDHEWRKLKPLILARRGEKKPDWCPLREVRHSQR